MMMIDKRDLRSLAFKSEFIIRLIFKLITGSKLSAIIYTNEDACTSL
jgi:hypothetical protein